MPLTRNESFPVVASYFAKQTLAEIGYAQSIDDLEQWEFEAYMLIASTWGKLEKKHYAK